MTWLIFFLALLIQSLGGFGGGLFAVPLLTMLHEPKFIIPPFSLVVLLLNMVILFEVRESIDWKTVSAIVTGSLFGLPAGVAALNYLDQDVTRLVIAAVTLALGIVFLCGFKPRLRPTRGTFVAAGLASGFLGGAAAMSGPPLIFLEMVMGFRKDTFRATLIACFIFNSAISNSLYLFSGLFNPTNMRIVILGIIPALAGSLLGIKAKNRMPEAVFSRVAVVMIVLIGLMGTWRAALLLLR